MPESDKQVSHVELPEDTTGQAVAWILPGRPPTHASLSEADRQKLNGWLGEKLSVLQPGEIAVVWKKLPQGGVSGTPRARAADTQKSRPIRWWQFWR